jgi:hypothetical protein
MLAQQTMPTIRWSALLKKANTNEDFKQRLLSDPKGAIEQETGIRLPENMNIVTHEQSANTIHLVLPTAPSEDPDPLCIFL